MNEMDTREVLMHIAACQAHGQETVCDDKTRYGSEASASRAAITMSIKTEDAIEYYPCPFCDKWHVGRAMTAEEKAKFS
jgi:hypothetical protein